MPLPFERSDRNITMSQSKTEGDGKTSPGIKALGLILLIPMSLVPIGVGLTVLGFVWFSTDAFGGPPLFFKIFGSFVALGFVGFGAIPLMGAIYGGSAAAGWKQSLDDTRAANQSAAAKNFVCPHCSAPLANLADVSSAGDVQCSFCHGWFNTRAS
jgi:hypothetical protein